MSTSVHFPKDLLEKVDKRASAMQVSRNRFIVNALEHDIAEQIEWTAEFLESLEQLTSLKGEDKLSHVIKESRCSIAPPKL